MSDSAARTFLVFVGGERTCASFEGWRGQQLRPTDELLCKWDQCYRVNPGEYTNLGGWEGGGATIVCPVFWQSCRGHLVNRRVTQALHAHYIFGARKDGDCWGLFKAAGEGVTQISMTLGTFIHLPYVVTCSE